MTEAAKLETPKLAPKGDVKKAGERYVNDAAEISASISDPPSKSGSSDGINEQKLKRKAEQLREQPQKVSRELSPAGELIK
jgi:hypothetical protein